MAVIEGRMNASGKRFAIVASRWNEPIVTQLLDGANRVFRANGAESPDVAWVAGAWELPTAALAFAEKGYDGIVCIGCILQGATIHAAQLSNSVAYAIAELSIRKGVPITWGVLTCATQEEALERAGMKHGNKGAEAAAALIDVTSVKEQIQKS